MNSNVVPIDSLEKARKLIDSGLDILKISMDTAKPDVYREIRGVDEFDKATRAIGLIVQARGQNKQPKIWFNSIIMQKNYQEIGSVLDLAEKLGIDLVRFKPIDTFDIYKEKGIKVASQEDLFKAIKETMDNHKNGKIGHNLAKLLNNFSNYYRTAEKHPCFSPWIELYVQYYGGVRLCCEFYSKEYDVGNILEDDFKKIWNNQKMRKIRREFIKGNTFFPVCRTCNQFNRNLIMQQKKESSFWGKAIKVLKK
jgi:radical SAM protein with 4Fe4S-binding SPASM domain